MFNVKSKPKMKLINTPQMQIIIIKGCTAAQFTCSNGQCVPLSARCNNVNECNDGSDEQNCGNVKISS